MSNKNTPTAAPREMKMSPIGRPPADPSTISFADECFVTIGSREHYTVVLSAPRYPERFDDKAKAEAFARRCNRIVSTQTEPIRRRIKWTTA